MKYLLNRKRLSLRAKRSNLFVFLLLTSLLIALPVSADIPHLINYQGKLVDSEGNPIESDSDVRFKLYTTSSGGVPIWEEEQTVTASKGVFNVLLGNGTLIQGAPLADLDFDRQYYLALQVGSDEEMSPRQQIASAAYAFRAKVAEDIKPGGDGSNLNADMVDGFHASSTPEAGKLLALDEFGNVPPTAVYWLENPSRTWQKIFPKPPDGYLFGWRSSHGGYTNGGSCVGGRIHWYTFVSGDIYIIDDFALELDGMFHGPQGKKTYLRIQIGDSFSHEVTLPSSSQYSNFYIPLIGVPKGVQRIRISCKGDDIRDTPYYIPGGDEGALCEVRRVAEAELQ